MTKPCIFKNVGLFIFNALVEVFSNKSDDKFVGENSNKGKEIV